MSKVLCIVLSGLTSLVGSSAIAQVDEEYRLLIAPIGAMMNGCLEQSTDREQVMACLDLTAQACASMGPGGGTTYGIVMCNNVLYPLWDDELNRLWPLVRSGLSKREADLLLQEQRAWIAAKEATCRLESARYAGGSMGAYSGGVCLIAQTAERVAEFREMLQYR